MRNNATKVLEEAYKQVIKENRISQMQPEEIMSLDLATLNNLTITVGELARLSDEQLQALKKVASKLTYPATAGSNARRLASMGPEQLYGIPNPDGGPNIPYKDI